VGYFGSADDILIIYDNRITSIKNFLEEFNNIYCTLNLTTEEENENLLNFLDVTLKRVENHININISIFRNPTTKNCIIPRDFCHPTGKTFTAIRYFSSRMRNINWKTQKKKPRW
jgi:hypothetical protein